MFDKSRDATGQPLPYLLKITKPDKVSWLRQFLTKLFNKIVR